MKKLKIVVLSLAAILGLTMAVLAFGKLAGDTQTVVANKAACCADKTCCEGDSCKAGGACCEKHSRKTAATETKSACCNDASCCKSDSCKMNGACCQSQDACPLKNRQSETEKDFDVNKAAVKEGGKSCCKGKMKADL